MVAKWGVNGKAGFHGLRTHADCSAEVICKIYGSESTHYSVSVHASEHDLHAEPCSKAMIPGNEIAQPMHATHSARISIPHDMTTQDYQSNAFVLTLPQIQASAHDLECISSYCRLP